MITLMPISKHEYQNLVDWNKGKDEDYLYQWAGHKVYLFPLTVEQILVHDQAHDSQIYMIYLDEKAVGSVELDNIDEEQSSAKVCRFILSDEVQNKGVGTLVLTKLSDMAFHEMNLDSLTLGVFCFNIGAMRCYEKCGFLVKTYLENDDPKWNAFIMEKRA